MLSGKFTSTARLDGKTAIVTGCNTGIGKVTAKEFYRLGARVIMACRDISKAEQAVSEIVADVNGDNLGQLVVEQLDLASFISVRRCAKNILLRENKIHVLVNNAGVMACPKGRTEDGFETQFGVNHLGHFLFTSLLLPKIRNSTPARIVNVSSYAHRSGTINFDDINHDKSFSSLTAYCQSKLANVLFSNELSRRLEGTGVNVYCLHPGVVATELGRTIDRVYFPYTRLLARILYFPFIKTPEEGAQTTLHCAIDEKAGEETGLYYSDCEVKETSALANDQELAKKLWDKSMEMVRLKETNYDMFKCEDQGLPEPIKDI